MSKMNKALTVQNNFVQRNKGNLTKEIPSKTNLIHTDLYRNQLEVKQNIKNHIKCIKNERGFNII